jgi:predicted nucleic acid-binding protein
MNIVISDTTALIILAKSNTLKLLSNLFQIVYIPQAVKDELNIKDDVVKYRIDKFQQIIIKPIIDTYTFDQIQKFNLDKGESEAITLALELNMKLIIDERKGRKIAAGQGIKVLGSLGLLIENYRQEFISFEESQYYFKLFKQYGLRVSEGLEEVFFEKLKNK